MANSSSTEALLPLVYEELRALASRYYLSASGASVAPTSIVHEAFLKLAGKGHFTGEEHFAAVAATAMRQVLVDRVRREKAARRGGGWERVSLSLALEGAAEQLDLEAVDAALSKLQALDARQARIVELRFFGGLTVLQVSKALEVSTSTVEKEWRSARAWLSAQLGA
ncbi:MAG: sigma-70 family RNA polymerase sigma factor [Myxococcaceae bacterium]|nr:sigma-70 family RNA polymerase sigma factor [Myxococcaceae bacterium]